MADVSTIEMAPLTDLTDTNADVDRWFLLASGAMVFLMQAGFAMLCAGSVRAKNTKNILLKNFLDACAGCIGFLLFGYAFAFGEKSNAFIGYSNFFLVGLPEDKYVEWFFQFAFAATAATIVSGAVAERTQMIAYLGYASFLTSFVYPVVVHWIWGGGFLAAGIDNPLLGVGVVDFAGSGVVHMVGGISAVVGAYFVGPRIGRFNADGTSNNIPGHSTTLAVLGTFILWFGWYGFNPGSALGVTGGASIVAAKTAVTTTIGAVGGALSVLIIEHIKTGDWGLLLPLNGALTGLVSITAPCAVVEPWAALVIGFVGGMIYELFSAFLEKVHIDDVVDASPVHFAGGLWGLLAVGLFATKENLAAAYGGAEFETNYGLFYGGGWNMLAAQAIAGLCIMGWTTLLMAPFFAIMSKFDKLRCPTHEEVAGLDMSHHGGAAYPELAKIKSIGMGVVKSEELKQATSGTTVDAAKLNAGGTGTQIEMGRIAESV